MIVRLPEQPDFLLRERGPRDFSEIPREEIAEAMRFVRAKGGRPTREQVLRGVLSLYGLLKLGAQIRVVLESVYKETIESDSPVVSETKPDVRFE